MLFISCVSKAQNLVALTIMPLYNGVNNSMEELNNDRVTLSYYQYNKY